MARDLSARTVLTLVVRVATALHIGDGGGAADTSPVLRDATGRPIVPGTSLTGALRSALGAAGDDESVWGSADDDGAASRVVVADSPFVLPDDVLPGRRDGVGIDRALGSAADERLYARETVPAGATATLRVEIDSSPDTVDTDRLLLSDIRRVVGSGRFALGARTRRGLGRLELVTASATVRHYCCPAHFWPTRDVPATLTLPDVPEPASDAVEIEIRWHAASPLVVAAGGLDTTQPRQPVLEPHPDDPHRMRQILPGTSIAGALRSRAELICRTLAGPVTPAAIDEQLTSTPLVGTVFGGPAGELDATASPLHVDDCASTTTILRTQWLDLLGPLPPRRTIADDCAEILLTDHVAIDRWTGGAADQRLYQVAEPHGFRFEPIRMRLHRDRIADGDRDAATALLLITLREFVEGRVPLGGGTHRGLGAVEIDGIRITGVGIDESVLDIGSATWAGTRAAWRDWVAAQPRRDAA